MIKPPLGPVGFRLKRWNLAVVAQIFLIFKC
jgi:hypothetical protein